MKTVKYLKEYKQISITYKSIYKIYNEIRRIIYKYLSITYQTDILGEENKNDYFSVDESLFTHLNLKQIWILGIINNAKKEFRLEGSFKRDA